MPRKLETIRNKITELQQEVAELREDRRTHDETADRLDRWVDAQAEGIDTNPLVQSAAFGDRHINTDSLRTDKSPLAWLAWLDPEALKRRLRADLDQVAPDVCSDLPASERRKALKAKEAELAKLEDEEEAAITELEKTGEVIPRRRDVDPTTVLGVEEDPEPADDEQEAAA